MSDWSEDEINQISGFGSVDKADSFLNPDKQDELVPELTDEVI